MLRGGSIKKVALFERGEESSTRMSMIESDTIFLHICLQL